MQLRLEKLILLGNLSNVDVYNYYKKNSIDLFINVSIFEGLPVSIMEALAFGIPCLATKTGGVSEIINDNNGKLIEKRITYNQLANEINIILKNKDRWILKRSIARETASKKYNAHLNYNNFIDILYNLPQYNIR